MRVTVEIDDDLYKQAKELSPPGLDSPSDLLMEVLAMYVRVQAARRLSALGGKATEMKDIPRRR